MFKKFLPLIIAAILLSFIGFLNESTPRTNLAKSFINDTGLESNIPSISKSLTINKFSTHKSEHTICIGGDVNLSETMAGYIAGGLQPFGFINPVTSDCDLYIINLETNVSDANVGKRQQKNYAFKAPPSTLQTLVDAKVHAVSLANNHTKDYGAEALIDQFKHLDNYGIAHFGAGANIDQAFLPLILDIGGLKVGLIGLNDAETRIGNANSNVAGSAFLNASRVKNAISQAKAVSDLVIVLPHWGIEHQTRASAKQVQWGRNFIDWGADLVAGAHPHVRQNIEEYKGKKIYYSLGNYVFSGFAGREEAQKAILLKIKVKDGQIINYQDIQLQLDYTGFPSPV